jgi:hypothetical protein
MKKMIGCALGAMLLSIGGSLAFAQESQNTSATTPPPKVLQVVREFVKPGKGGSAHEKAESGFVQAFARAKWPTHCFAATSVTGKSRALFFIPYDSFEAWEKDNMATQKNAALSAALDRASTNDGELLSEIATSLLTYNEEQSLRAPVDIAHMRYFEISLFRVRPGHRKEWSDLVKLVKDAYEKVPDTHWAMYEAEYAQEDVTYVVFVPMKSASEIDQGPDREKQFMAAMGEDGMKKLAELESSAVEFVQTNLFQFAPSMSYPPDAWVKADPEFWKAKPAEGGKAPAKKAEEKPVETQ